jgi:hypothetical protein
MQLREKANRRSVAEVAGAPTAIATLFRGPGFSSYLSNV